MKIYKNINCVNGKIEKCYLMQSTENKSLKYRQYFETSGYNDLEFCNTHALIDFLEQAFKDSDDNTFFVCHDKIFYQDKKGDKILEYFGTIEE